MGRISLVILKGCRTGYKEGWVWMQNILTMLSPVHNPGSLLTMLLQFISIPRIKPSRKLLFSTNGETSKYMTGYIRWEETRLEIYKVLVIFC